MDSKVLVALLVGLGLGFGGGWVSGNRNAQERTVVSGSRADSGSDRAARPTRQLQEGDGEKRSLADAKEHRRFPKDRARKPRGMRGEGKFQKPMNSRPLEDPSAVYKIPVGNAPVIGAADAKVTIIEISDYQCPYCAKANRTMHEILALYPDTVRIAMKQNPLSFHENARNAAKAALAAGEQGKYWEMHDKLFEVTMAREALTAEKIDSLASELGIDMAAFREAVSGDKFDKRIDEEQQQAVSLGARSTPGFFINGRKFSGARPTEQFQKIIDEEIAHADELLAKGVAIGSLYDEIIKDGSTKPVLLGGGEMPPEPPNPFVNGGPVKDVSIPATSPFKGPAEGAKVTMIEFLDFQCPHCAKTAKTLIEVASEYPADVKVVFRHRPLSSHPQARNAALASMAAHKQGKFWEMEAKIYENMRELSDEKLEAIAEEVGLDMAAFKADWKSAETAALVDADAAEADRLGIRATPTMFFNGHMLIGGRPAGMLRKFIADEISGGQGGANAAPEDSAQPAGPAAE